MPDAGGGSHVNEGFALIKPEFHVVNKAKHERGAFGMQIPRLVRHNPCPRHGVQDGQQSCLGFFACISIAQGSDKMVLIGVTGRGHTIGRRGTGGRRTHDGLVILEKSSVARSRSWGPVGVDTIDVAFVDECSAQHDESECHA